MLREIVLAWEKLRLLYNALLAVPGLSIVHLSVTRTGLSLPDGAIGALFVGICANIAFLLGPAAEIYLRGLLREGGAFGRGRLLIFGAGLLCSAGVFGLVLTELLSTPP